MFLFDVRASNTLYNQEKIMPSAKTIYIYGNVKFLDNSFFIRENLSSDILNGEAGWKR